MLEDLQNNLRCEKQYHQQHFNSLIKEINKQECKIDKIKQLLQCCGNKYSYQPQNIRCLKKEDSCCKISNDCFTCDDLVMCFGTTYSKNRRNKQNMCKNKTGWSNFLKYLCCFPSNSDECFTDYKQFCRNFGPPRICDNDIEAKISCNCKQIENACIRKACSNYYFF